MDLKYFKSKTDNTRYVKCKYFSPSDFIDESKNIIPNDERVCFELLYLFQWNGINKQSINKVTKKLKEEILKEYFEIELKDFYESILINGYIKDNGGKTFLNYYRQYAEIYTLQNKAIQDVRNNKPLYYDEALFEAYEDLGINQKRKNLSVVKNRLFDNEYFCEWGLMMEAYQKATLDYLFIDTVV